MENSPYREGLCVDTQLNLKQTTFSEAVVIIFKNIIEHLMTSCSRVAFFHFLKIGHLRFKIKFVTKRQGGGEGIQRK